MPVRSAMGPADPGRALIGLVLKLGVFVAVLIAANQVGSWVLHELGSGLRPSTEPYVHQLIMVATLIYIVLMTLPFVPGIEIGIVMMAMFGAKIVPLVYLATGLALVLGFVMGRFIPQQSILSLLSLLRLRSAKDLLSRLEPLGPNERLEFLLHRASRRWLPFLIRHWHAAVAVALNVPGNAIIGGGGGISLAAGFNRLYSLPAYALTVGLAVAPYPLAVWLSGA